MAVTVTAPPVLDLPTDRAGWIQDLKTHTGLTTFSVRLNNCLGDTMLALTPRVGEAAGASDDQVWSTFTDAFTEAATAAGHGSALDVMRETLLARKQRILTWLRDVAARATGGPRWPTTWQRWRDLLVEESALDSGYLEGSARWVNTNRERLQTEQPSLALLSEQMQTGVQGLGYHLPSAYGASDSALYEAVHGLLFPVPVPVPKDMTAQSITEAVGGKALQSEFQKTCILHGVQDTIDAMRCQESVTDWPEYLRTAIRSYGHSRFAGRTRQTRQVLEAAHAKFWGKGLTPKQWQDRMDRYRVRVAAVAGKYGEMHNMCSTLNNAVAELGVTPGVAPEQDLVFTGNGITVKVAVTTWYADPGVLRDKAAHVWGTMTGEQQRKAVMSQDRVHVNWRDMKVV